MRPEPEFAGQYRVLVIEDGPILQKSLSEYLLFEGFAVTAASDRHEALKTSDQFPFDVILMDVITPGSLQGDDFVRRVRSRSQNHMTPVVYMTAWARYSSTDSSLVLEKPFEPNVLVSTLRQAIEDSSVRHINSCFHV